MTGTVKFFREDHGYGFINAADGDGSDYFFHFSSLQMDGYKTCSSGDRVTFDTREGKKGLEAYNVTVTKD